MLIDSVKMFRKSILPFADFFFYLEDATCKFRNVSLNKKWIVDYEKISKSLTRHLSESVSLESEGRNLV